MWKALPLTVTPSLPHTSLAETSTFGLSRLPYWDWISTVRRAAGAVTRLMTPPIA